MLTLLASVSMETNYEAFDVGTRPKCHSRCGNVILLAGMYFLFKVPHLVVGNIIPLFMAFGLMQ